MKLKDVRIGTEFQTAEGRLWRVTDVGRRTLSAIVIEMPEGTLPPGLPDASWLNGPPYLVEEVLFDEKDIDAAFTSIDTAIRETLHERSAHPGFPNEVMGLLMHGKLGTRRSRYPFPRVLRFDRFDPSVQDVLHPYGVSSTDQGWSVQVYRLFAQTFEERDDRAFVALPLASEAYLRQARAHHRTAARRTPEPWLGLPTNDIPDGSTSSGER